MSGSERCILAYGLDVMEIMKLQQARVKIIRITDDMTKMKVRDILDGSTEKVASDKELKNEKVIVFNNVPNMQLEMVISLTKRVLRKRPILATVTETSMEWDFDYLIEHLMEEREWHNSGKEGAVHEQE
ncbi:MAG: DUF3783 domain-containing protein [Sarcina sp.]